MRGHFPSVTRHSLWWRRSCGDEFGVPDALQARALAVRRCSWVRAGQDGLVGLPELRLEPVSVVKVSATVDDEALTGDEAGCLGGEEADGVGDVLRGAHAAGRDGREVGGLGLVGNVGVAFDWDEAGRDRVDGDAV